MSKKKKCPKCQKELIKTKEDGINIDICTSCKGMWLEEGELSYLVKTWKDLPFINTKKGKRIRKTPFSCPVCSSTLDELQYDGKHKEIFIEKCSNCKGIWLDYYEYEKIKGKVQARNSSSFAKSFNKSIISKLAIFITFVTIIVILYIAFF